MPYLFQPHVSHCYTGSDLVKRHLKQTYQVIAAIPANAARQLKTKATMPLAVKPAGNAAAGLFWPFRFKKSFVLAAALPEYGTPAALQLAKWS
jgi:hypothetical protein